MNIQKITTIASLILISNSVHSNEMIVNEHAQHMQHDHSSMDMATETNEENTLYVCPMHPDIMMDSPSTCPICGMNLEKVEFEEK